MMSKSIFQSKTGTDYMKWTQIRYCIGQLPTETHKKWGSEGKGNIKWCNKDFET